MIKRLLKFSTLFLIMVSLAIPTTALAATTQVVIPTFTITAVVRDTTVTIYTYNFPKNDNFDVLMNYMGTQGKNGIKVSTLASGGGGSFSATFPIPTDLKGLPKIAIRLQSNTGSGYYSYNWFFNNSTSGSSDNGSSGNGNGYSGIPTFSITSVVRNTSVTILTNNFPKNDKFDVLMNTMGTQGINGIMVGTMNSGDGGAFSATFTIPTELKGLNQISIRLQSNTGTGYYAYNWFYNNTTK